MRCGRSGRYERRCFEFDWIGWDLVLGAYVVLLLKELGERRGVVVVNILGFCITLRYTLVGYGINEHDNDTFICITFPLQRRIQIQI